MSRHDERRLIVWFCVAALSFDALLAYTLLAFVSRSAPLFGLGATV